MGEGEVYICMGLDWIVSQYLDASLEVFTKETGRKSRILLP